MKVLDLFCGLGGWSDGLALEGFEVLGVELDPRIAELYKHPVIVADVATLDPSDFTGYDLIVGSPPCRDFTQLPDHAVKRNGQRVAWKDPKNPTRGLINVHVFLRFVEEAAPGSWLMENVVGLTKHLEIKHRMIVRLTRGKRRAFWGTFPAFLVPRDFSHGLHLEYKGPLRAWERARIPLPVARALGQAVSTSLGDGSPSASLTQPSQS